MSREDHVATTQRDPATVERWNARNRAATMLAQSAANFRWPAAIVEETGDPSDARRLLVGVRVAYQRLMRTRLATYRALRNRGDEAGADRTLRSMVDDVDAQANRVFELRRIYDATIIERMGADLTATAAAARSLIATVGTGMVNAATGAGIGLGFGFVLVALAFLYLKGR